MLSRTHEIVLKQADFDASAAATLGARIGGGCVAQTQNMNAVERDLVVENEVAHDGIGHLLRIGDSGLTVSRGITADFNDVAVLILQRTGHLVEGVFRLLAQNALTRTEAELGLRSLLVLPEAANRLLRG